MKFRVTKVKSKFKSSACKRASCKWKRYQLWILLNLWKKCLTFGENRGNIQKIYDSVRKELQDEWHCAWSLGKMVEKLNHSSCIVKFCWFGIIAQTGRVEFTAAKSEGIVAFNFIVHFFKKTEFDFHNFIVVIKCKIYLENVYCVFCWIFCCLRLNVCQILNWNISA